MGWGSLTVGRKIVLPYLALALLIGTLAAAVAGVETAAVASDQVNALAGREADSLGALITGAEQSQRLELRLLTAAAAFTAIDRPLEVGRLHDALLPMVINGGGFRVSILDPQGVEVLRMEAASGGGCLCSAPGRPLQWPHLGSVQAGVTDPLGDQWTGTVLDEGVWRLYDAGTVFSPDGSVAGVLVLSEALSVILARAEQSLGFQAALYTPSGEQMAASTWYPIRPPQLTAGQRAGAMTARGSLRMAIDGEDAQQIFFVPLRIGSAVTGYAAVVVDGGALVRADSTLQTLLVAAAAALLLIVMVAGWHVTRSVTVPLERLLKAIAEVTKSPDQAAPVSANEIARLTESFKNITSSLESSAEATVLALAAAIEARDQYTHGHSVRVAAYSLILARAADLETADLEIIRRGCLVHDIGKIGVPDGVLGKPGGLDLDELAAIQRHPEVGCQVLRALDWEPRVFEIVAQHHERWDGGGYPAGLAGEEIAPLARIVALADALDAMTSTRPYRTALSFSEAVYRVRAAAGTQFDPEVVALFEAVRAELNFCRRSFESLAEQRDLFLEAIA